MYTIMHNGKTLYDPRLPGFPVERPKLAREANVFDTLTFTLYPPHQEYGDLDRSSSILGLYQDSGLVAQFIPVYQRTVFNGGIEYKCKNILCCMEDFYYRPLEFSGTASGFIDSVLTAYNARVDNAYKITKGNIHPASVDYKTSEPKTCFSALKAITDANGGYLAPRFENGTIYLDYLQDADLPVCEQKIVFGDNMTDLFIEKDTDNCYSVLYPFGTNSDNEVVSIADANGGVDYLENASAVASYGRREKKMSWANVETPAELLSYAQTKLSEIAAQYYEAVSLSAVDLHHLDVNIPALSFLSMVDCVSAPHGYSHRYPATKMEIPLDEPKSESITLGTAPLSMTDRITLERQKNEAARSSYGRAISKADKDIESHWVHVTQVTDKGMSDSFGIIGVKIGADGMPMKDASGNYIWDDTGTGGEIWGHLNRSAWTTVIQNHIQDANGRILSIGQVLTSADGQALITAINDQQTGTAQINADRIHIQSTSGSGIVLDNNGNISINAAETVTRINGQTGSGAVLINAGRVKIGTTGGASVTLSDRVTITSNGYTKLNGTTVADALRVDMQAGGAGFYTDGDVIQLTAETRAASLYVPSSNGGWNAVINAIADIAMSESGGVISLTPTYLDGASGTPKNFNIAATQFYIDGVAAAGDNGYIAACDTIRINGVLPDQAGIVENHANRATITLPAYTTSTDDDGNVTVTRSTRAPNFILTKDTTPGVSGNAYIRYGNVASIARLAIGDWYVAGRDASKQAVAAALGNAGWSGTVSTVINATLDTGNKRLVVNSAIANILYPGDTTATPVSIGLGPLDLTTPLTNYYNSAVASVVITGIDWSTPATAAYVDITPTATNYAGNLTELTERLYLNNSGFNISNGNFAVYLETLASGSYTPRATKALLLEPDAWSGNTVNVAVKDGATRLAQITLTAPSGAAPSAVRVGAVNPTSGWGVDKTLDEYNRQYIIWPQYQDNGEWVNGSPYVILTPPNNAGAARNSKVSAIDPTSGQNAPMTLAYGTQYRISSQFVAADGTWQNGNSVVIQTRPDNAGAARAAQVGAVNQTSGWPVNQALDEYNRQYAIWPQYKDASGAWQNSTTPYIIQTPRNQFTDGQNSVGLIGPYYTLPQDGALDDACVIAARTSGKNPPDTGTITLYLVPGATWDNETLTWPVTIRAGNPERGTDIAATVVYVSGVYDAGKAAHNVVSFGSITLSASDTGSSVTKYPAIRYANGDGTNTIPITIDASALSGSAQSRNVLGLSEIELLASDAGSVVTKTVTVFYDDDEEEDFDISVDATAISSGGGSSGTETVTISSSQLSTVSPMSVPQSGYTTLQSISQSGLTAGRYILFTVTVNTSTGVTEVKRFKTLITA